MIKYHKKGDYIHIGEPDESNPELSIEQKLTFLERQVDKCLKNILPSAIALQADMSYNVDKDKISEKQYLEYKTQLNIIVKTFLNKCTCNEDTKRLLQEGTVTLLKRI